MSVKLLTEQHLEFQSLKGSCTCSSESTLVKMPHCWKSHVAAHLALTLFDFSCLAFDPPCSPKEMYIFYICTTVRALMPRLHLPRSSYDLFLYNFLYDFFGTVGRYKLRCMRLHCLRSPYDFFRRQTRTKPYRDLADIVRQPQGYRTIIVLSSRPPHINRTMPVR